MKINIELNEGFLPDSITNSVIEIVSSSLNSINTTKDGFIINDRVFLRKQNNGKITPCVMNSASYISRKFQSNLAMHDGCYGESKRLDQNIDGLIELDYSGVSYSLKSERDVVDVSLEYIRRKGLDRKAINNLFPMFYGMYMERTCFNIPDVIDTANLFDGEHIDVQYNIGVEFETGNVASSFRAINKLNGLFQQGEIDGGCFITSVDKSSSATRIWPVSNRNGSFQELKQRRYINQISLPLICIGFAPDGFSEDVGFLSNLGDLYYLNETDTIDDGTRLKLFIDNNGNDFFSAV
ncbi:TPA: hypothetical protein U2J86_005066 [Serratia marcescens]|nr:hypothetical protein [Serratia marcescens]